MTVDELVKMLKRYDGNMVVEIRVHNPSAGPSRGTQVKTVQGGIDWDKGRLFIYPEKHLVEVI